MSLPGLTWRLLAHRLPDLHLALDLRFQPPQNVEFDELVIGDWLHLEQMDKRYYWLRVGDVDINVYIPPNGAPEVSIERGIHT